MAPTPRASRVELSALGGLFGSIELGSRDALMLTNSVPTSGQTALFATTTTQRSAPLVEGRVGVRVWRAVWVEGAASYARPDFAVAISADTEGAPDVTATSRLTQATADVSVHYRWEGRLAPYVFGGGGYLRQLDEPRTTAENGWTYFGGAGLRWRLAPASRGFMGRLSIRGEARLLMLQGAIAFPDDRGTTVSVLGGLSLTL
ncbi:hypothetical protein [Luteitalea sp. TBR-22]|uniref:hypothetical protein n=1 Tax=Luteitalea sp. TBR-22 TaxID=2802971 RepID=UPI001EF6E978|nr:hypothetical protein [Luteitalea sp. TBR-22]